MILTRLKKILYAVLAGSAMAGCNMVNSYTAIYGSAGPLVIYPDYKEVTIPANMAPLNFHYAVKGARKARTTFSVGDKSVTVPGLEVEWSLRRWKTFLSGAEGRTITVDSEVTVDGQSVSETWHIYVSTDPVDGYLTYRLIEPSYQMFHELSIMERCVENFDETVICDYKHTDNACMNCHTHAQQRGDLSLYYIRGAHGGAVLNRDGRLRKLSLKTQDMVSGTVYGEIHPSGRFGVFSTNIILPSLHTEAQKRIEVYDTVSDLTVADFDNNEMINMGYVARADKLETFPCFSADGESVFYCIADTVSLPDSICHLKYSLVRADFDSGTGVISEQVDTLWSAAEHNASVCHPKVSPDGRWVMFTVADYGTFPIGHPECSLQMINLETGELNPLEGIRYDDSGSDSYHSWSSDGKWFVFSSKRGDGQFAKPYYCHIDKEGRTTKPFVLPQKSSRFYELFLKSFNVPDIGRESTGMTVRDAGRMFDAPAETFE